MGGGWFLVYEGIESSKRKVLCLPILVQVPGLVPAQVDICSRQTVISRQSSADIRDKLRRSVGNTQYMQVMGEALRLSFLGR